MLWEVRLKSPGQGCLPWGGTRLLGFSIPCSSTQQQTKCWSSYGFHAGQNTGCFAFILGLQWHGMAHSSWRISSVIFVCWRFGVLLYEPLVSDLYFYWRMPHPWLALMYSHQQTRSHGCYDQPQRAGCMWGRSLLVIIMSRRWGSNTGSGIYPLVLIITAAQPLTSLSPTLIDQFCILRAAIRKERISELCGHPTALGTMIPVGEGGAGSPADAPWAQGASRLPGTAFGLWRPRSCDGTVFPSFKHNLRSNNNKHFSQKGGRKLHGVNPKGSEASLKGESPCCCPNAGCHNHHVSSHCRWWVGTRGGTVCAGSSWSWCVEPSPEVGWRQGNVALTPLQNKAFLMTLSPSSGLDP